MKNFIIIFITLIAIFKAGAEELNFSLNQFYMTDDGFFYLETETEKYELVKDENNLLKTANVSQSTLKDLLVQVNILHGLHSVELTAQNLINLFNKIKNKFLLEQDSDDELLDYTANICFVNGDKICLKILRQLTDKNNFNAYLLVLEADLETNFDKKYKKINQALILEPKSKKIKNIAQLFSLKLAEQFLDAYINEHDANGLNKKLGFNTLEDGHVSYIDVLRELTFNTLNTIALLTTEYAQMAGLLNKSLTGSYLEIWQKQQEDLNLIKKQIRNLISKMESTEMTIEEILENNFFIRSTFVESLKKQPLYDFKKNNDTLINNLGFKPELDFVDTNWKDFLIHELSFFNIYILLKGPAIFKAFGKSSFGVSTINLLKLNSLVKKIGKIKPEYLKNVATFVILEIADGCAIRYGYLIYKGLIENK